MDHRLRRGWHNILLLLPALSAQQRADRINPRQQDSLREAVLSCRRRRRYRVGNGDRIQGQDRIPGSNGVAGCLQQFQFCNPCQGILFGFPALALSLFFGIDLGKKIEHVVVEKLVGLPVERTAHSSILGALRRADHPTRDGGRRDGTFVAPPFEVLEPLLFRLQITHRIEVALDGIDIQQTLGRTVLDCGRQRFRFLDIDGRNDVFVGHIEDRRDAAEGIETIEFVVTEPSQHLRTLDLVIMGAVPLGNEPRIGNHAAAFERTAPHQQLHLIGCELVPDFVPHGRRSVETGYRVEFGEDKRVAHGLKVASIHFYIVPGQHIADRGGVPVGEIPGQVGTDGGRVRGIPGRIGNDGSRIAGTRCRIGNDGRQIGSRRSKPDPDQGVHGSP